MEQEYNAETLLLWFYVDFPDKVSYEKYDFIPVGTQCILLNEDTMIVGNQSGILFPIAEEISQTETDLIAMIKPTGKEKSYELIEYILDVNTQYTQVLIKQDMRIGGGSDVKIKASNPYNVDELVK